MLQPLVGGGCCHSLIGFVVGNHMINGKNDIPGGYLVVALPEEFYVFHVICLITCGCTELNEDTIPSYFVGKKSTTVQLDLSAELNLFQLQIKKKQIGKPHDMFFGFSGSQKKVLEVAALIRHYNDGGSENNMPTWMRSFKEMAKVLFPILREATIRP